jgi:hypothetical protein
MRLFRRSEVVPVDVRERAGLARRTPVLASGQADDGRWLLGTPDALVVVGADVLRLPWSEVQAVDWDGDEGRLLITGVGTFGQPRPRHGFRLTEQGLLLQLVRERVQASIVLQRRFPVERRRGFTVIGRRTAGGPIAWMVEYDDGIDLADPGVGRLVEEALARARGDVGE